MRPSDASGLLQVSPGAAPLAASVRVPSSKSIANRVLVCAALADGASVVSGLPAGDDTASMIEGVVGVGARVRESGGALVVTGSKEHARAGGAQLRCGLAGTTSRFLTAVAALGANWTVVDGDEPLRRRPISGLLEALRGIGASVESTGKDGLPVRVRRGATGLGGRVHLDASVSSQFISALMMIGPAMDSELEIVLEGDPVSYPYLLMTAAVMSRFGARVDVAATRITVAPTGYAPCDITVEGDYSSAAFPLVAPLLRDGSVTVGRLAGASLQADARIVTILGRSGATLEYDDDVVRCRVEEADALRPFDEDLRDCSDLLPALCVAATAIDGASRFTGVGFVRGKESDRLSAMATELAKFGHRCDVEPDGIVVHGSRGRPSAKGAVRVDTHHDHRLAMALALLSLRHGTVVVGDPDVVAKSWPGYWADMSEILGD